MVVRGGGQEGRMEELQGGGRRLVTFKRTYLLRITTIIEWLISSNHSRVPLLLESGRGRKSSK